MKQIQAIQNKIEALKAKSNKAIVQLEIEQSTQFEKLMKGKKKQAVLKEYISQVETSKNLYQENEWFSAYASVDFSKLIDDKDKVQQKLLKDYLMNLGYYPDFGNGVLFQSLGPNIIINDEGDVLDQDSNKWIIGSKEYNTNEELCSQIEAYMQKTGCYPAVIRVDRYGNGVFVNTSKKG